MMRCCGNWVYQQLGWWCFAVATDFISSKDGALLWPMILSAARLVVLCCGHWVYQQQGWWCFAVASGFISSKARGAVL